MDARSGLTLVDTNVFVIDLRYRRDRHFSVNRRFLTRLARIGDGATSIFNVLEVCGILSFNLNAHQLRELFHYFPQKYHIQVLPISQMGQSLPSFTVENVFRWMEQKASFGDALLMAALVTYLPEVVRFVSWDADHFRGKLRIPVLTPQEFLRKGSGG